MSFIAVTAVLALMAALAVSPSAAVVIAKVHRALVTYGLGGTAKLSLAAAGRGLLWFNPAHRRARRLARQSDTEFDRRWGVDTCGTHLPARSEVTGRNWIYGIKYEASNANTLAATLRDLAVDYAQFSFVDLGSGKGRAILAASQFAFKSVIGVEYCAALHEVARRNLGRFPQTAKRCGALETVCGDAARYPIPDGPLILFLFNPFGRPLMETVMNNVRRSFHEQPRRIIVIYFNPLFADVWKGAGFLHQRRATERLTIFDSQPGASSGVVA